MSIKFIYYVSASNTGKIWDKGKKERERQRKRWATFISQLKNKEIKIRYDVHIDDRFDIIENYLYHIERWGFSYLKYGNNFVTNVN